MPLWLPPNALGKTQSNLSATVRNGTVITAGSTAHVKGAYSAGQLIASTDEDTYGVTICVNGLHVVATVTSYLLDIGIGPSGSEVDLIQDLDCWGADLVGTQGSGNQKTWFFPVFIPKGERVAARAQALAVSDVANVVIFLHQAADGWGMEVPVMWERLGAVTNSNGVSVPQASGAFGAWTTILDPITKNYRWWHVGFDGLADTTITTEQAVLEIGIGDTTADVTTIGTWQFGESVSEIIGGPIPAVPVFAPLVDDDAKGVFARIAAGSAESRGVLVYAGE